MHETTTAELAKNGKARFSNSSLIESPWHIAIAAALLRVVVTAQVIDLANIWLSGFEIVKIATSIVQGAGFSSPFSVPTGPTAWVPPVYPLFLATVFKLFGTTTTVSACVVIFVQISFSALTCVPVFRISEEIFDPRVAVTAAWGWACFPYELLVPGISIWESSLSALLLAVSIAYTLKLQRSSGPKQWATFGLLWGVAALTNAALLAVLPLQVVWPVIRQRRRGLKALAGMSVAGLMFIVTVSPWLLRNLNVYGEFVPFRDNFGVELWIGNHEGGTGEWNGIWHPSQSDHELSAFQREGELAYVQRKQHEAANFIKKNPATFARLSIKRAYYFWFGEPEFLRSPLLRFLYWSLSVLAFAGTAFALYAKKPFFLLGAALLIFPIAYYITHVNPRYRHPIEPELMILSAYALTALARSLRRGLRSAA